MPRADARPVYRRLSRWAGLVGAGFVFFNYLPHWKATAASAAATYVPTGKIPVVQKRAFWE